MLHESGLPHFLWREAVRHTVWLKNRTPTKALDSATPLEAATGRKPDLHNMRPWGSKVWVRTEGGTKLRGHVEEGCWMGVDDTSGNGYRVYWPLKRSVAIEHNVYWDPAEIATIPREGEEEDRSPNVMISSPSYSPPEPTPPVTAPRTPKTTPHPKLPITTASPILDMVMKRVRKPSQ
ncbi:hypothetical protein BDR04DRAFT_1027534 [Suillus decipiens]|nr:hypothetical protein BDR04DRAFT_1027534 [Suillus decipiens]